MTCTFFLLYIVVFHTLPEQFAFCFPLQPVEHGAPMVSFVHA